MAPKYELSFKLKFLLFLLRFLRPDAHKLSLEKIKEIRKPFPVQWVADWVLGKPIPLHKVEDRNIPVRDAQIPIRIYWPSGEKDLPMILNFHGGGWVLGNLQQSDYYCREISKKVGAIVVSVDYRMAPEHPFPIPSQDCYDTLLWLHANGAALGGNPDKIAVTGDSAGGNLSIVMAMMARDLAGPKISFQGLIYPGTDGTFKFPSYDLHTKAPILPQEDLTFYRNTYEEKEGDRLHPYFSPSLANDLTNLPPSVVITAEYDPLVDDGRIFAEKLEAAGNVVEYKMFEKGIHGFMTMPNHCPQNRPGTALLVKGFRKYLL